MRQLPLHQQVRDPDRAADAAPAMVRKIEHDEQIAREKRRQDIGQLARMPDRLLPPRQEGAISLVFDLNLGARLAAWPRVGHVPSLAAVERRRSPTGLLALRVEGNHSAAWHSGSLTDSLPECARGPFREPD